VSNQHKSWSKGNQTLSGTPRALRMSEPGRARFGGECTCREQRLYIRPDQVERRAHAELIWRAPTNGGALGACHGLDVAPLFGTYERRLGAMLVGPEPPPKAET
jgi:hypothetical protein